MLDLAQDVAHGTMSKEPQALVLRAREPTFMHVPFWLGLTFREETRKTYRAIFSEPRLVIPGTQPTVVSQPETLTDSISAPTLGTKRHFDDTGDGQSRNPSKTEARSKKKRKNKQR